MTPELRAALENLLHRGNGYPDYQLKLIAPIIDAAISDEVEKRNDYWRTQRHDWQRFALLAAADDLNGEPYGCTRGRYHCWHADWLRARANSTGNLA